MDAEQDLSDLDISDADPTYQPSGEENRSDQEMYYWLDNSAVAHVEVVEDRPADVIEDAGAVDVAGAVEDADGEVVGDHVRGPTKSSHRQQQKQARASGEGYITFGTMNLNPPRALQENPCLRPSTCKHTCPEWTQEQREEVFKAYYEQDGNAQNSWILQHVEVKPAGRMRAGSD